MTHQPDIAHRANRRAIALLLAAVALPSTALAQETVTPPTVLAPSQQTPAPTASAPGEPGESRTRIAPGVLEQAEQEDRERAAAARAERAEARQQRQRAARAAAAQERATPPDRAAAPAPEPEPVPAPQPVEQAVPVASGPEATPPPVEAVPPAAEAPVTTTETTPAPEPATADGGSLWLILAALGLAAAAIAAFLLLRRRRDDDGMERDRAEPEPVAAAARPARAPVVRDKPKPVQDRAAIPAPRMADPAAAAPLFVTKAAVETNDAPQPALENAELMTADAADIDAVLGGAGPKGGRPRLELAMRPTRAGMSRRGAMVEFELTVANAGGAAAEDVRIGAFMLGDNSAAESEIERLLTNPPADQVVPAERIEPGDGTRLNASVTLPREQVDAAAGAGDDGFTPVLIADARYRLPDGGEGRTAAAFTIGRVNGGEALVPIALQDDPAIYADVEARLRSVPAKV